LSVLQRLAEAQTAEHVREVLRAFGMLDLNDEQGTRQPPEAAKPPEPPPYHVPGPYEIALAIAAGLAASGAYPNPGAAASAAWAAVPEFYAGRDWYLSELAPVRFGFSPGEGSADANEAA
jgi:hypothetical protein